MKILIGLDDSRYSLGAVRFVASYLAADDETEVHLVHALYHTPVGLGVWPSRRTRDVRRMPPEVRRIFDRATKRLTSKQMSIETRVRRGPPTAVLPELAAEGGYDLVVVGAKGRSDAPFLDIGSVALAVLEHVPMSVLMTREREPGRGWPKPTGGPPGFHVLFTTDGSAYSRAAAAAFFRFFDVPALKASAVAVAELPDAAMLRRMSARRREEFVTLIESAADDWLRRLEAQLEGYDLRPRSWMLRGRPAKALVDAAGKHGVDLAVLGSRGTRGTWGPRLGSTALGVARSSPCSVLIVRSPGRRATAP